MNCFHQLTSKCNSQLFQFGSGQGWTLHRKPCVGPSPAGLFVGCFALCDSCQFPAPTAGKGPVSLHCPHDIYCLVTALGPGWQQLVLWAGMASPAWQEKRRDKAGSWAEIAAAGDLAFLAPRGYGMGGEKQLCNATAGHCSWYLLRLPGEGSAPPAPPRWCPSTHPGCFITPIPQQEHQRGQGPHMKEKCLHPPCARNICPQGVCAHGHGGFYISCFSETGPQMCSQHSLLPLPLPVSAHGSSASAWADLHPLHCSGTWQVSGSCKI